MNSSNIQFTKFRNIEKGLIAVLLLSILLYYFVTGDKDLKASSLHSFVLIIEIGLILFYIFVTQNAYSLFFVGFLSYCIGYLLLNFQIPIGATLVLVGEFSQLGLGIFFLYKTIKDSIANKDFEMYVTLISLELMFPVINRYVLTGDEYTLIYSFALPFVLGIIMYNDNLWDKYNSSEKKILTYILVSAIAEVLFISVKLI